MKCMAIFRKRARNYVRCPNRGHFMHGKLWLCASCFVQAKEVARAQLARDFIRRSV